MVTYEKYVLYRNAKGLKDSEVARKAGIPASTFSDWKKGKSSPKEAKLRKIADALDISYGVMMGWSPEHESAVDALTKLESELIDYYYYSEDEQLLVENFRSLDDASKRQLILMMSFLKEQNNK